MKKELEKTYNPADIEDRLYAKWVNKKYFHAEVNANKKPYDCDSPTEYYRSASHGTCA